MDRQPTVHYFTEVEIRRRARELARYRGIKLTGLRWLLKLWPGGRLVLWIYGESRKTGAVRSIPHVLAE